LPNRIVHDGEVAVWVAWCASQGFDPATVRAEHIKRYRQALLEANYKPITIRWKLTIVRRFYEAARKFIRRSMIRASVLLCRRSSAHQGPSHQATLCSAV
jgi:site-specific recombinase XerD